MLLAERKLVPDATRELRQNFEIYDRLVELYREGDLADGGTTEGDRIFG